MADLNHYCFVLLMVILCCGIIDGRRNNKRQNKVRKCKKIETIYGGDVVYFGDRKIGAEVYYSCDDGYTQRPGDVESSVCKKKGNRAVWIPDPPVCLEMADVEVPVNGFTDTDLDVIEDGDSYNVFCDEGHELYRGGFKNMDSITITNYNGTLRPKVPSCKPARCDPEALNETIVSYLNGTEVTDLIENGSPVSYTCMPDHIFRNEYFGASVRGRCRYGEFLRVPRCIPKPCKIGDLALNSFTNIQYYQDIHTLLFPGLDVDHNSIIEITCRNHYQYELFVQSSQTFVNEFLAVCYFGDFDKTDGQFPVCQEKRCHFTESSEYCFWKNGTSRDICYNGDFYVPSRTNLNIRCSDGYRQDNEKDETISSTNCLHGKHSAWKSFDCVPLPCDVPQVRNAESTVGQPKVESSTNVTFKCNNGYHFTENPYTDIMESMCHLGDWLQAIPDNCEPDSCHLSVKDNTTYTVTDSSDNHKSINTSKLLPHGTDIVVACAEDFEMLDVNGNPHAENTSKVVKCAFGNWSNGAIITSVCRKKCTIPDDPRYQFTTDEGEVVPSRNLVRDGWNLTVTCTYNEYNSYSYYLDDSFILSDNITCINGNLTKIYLQCQEVPCDVPQVRNAESAEGQPKVESSTNVTFKCNNGHHFTEEPYTNSITSMCHNGDWTQTIPVYCEPDSCPLTVKDNTTYTVRDSSDNHTSINSTGLLRHGTDLVVSCAEDFDMFDANGNAENESGEANCAFGNWSNDAIVKTVCRKRCDVVNITQGELVNASESFARESIHHGAQVTYKCEHGHHFTEKPNTDIMESTCHLGDWTPIIPAYCEPDSCHLSVKDNTMYTVRDSSDNHTSINSTGLVRHGTDLVASCAEDFDMFDANGNPLAENISANCAFGNWSNDAIFKIVCRKRCSAVITHGSLVNVSKNFAGQSSQHGAKVTFKCNNGHHFTEEPYTDITESTCHLGDWTPTIPDCEPDSCALSVKDNTTYTVRDSSDNHTSINSTGLLRHGTDLVVACAEDFDMFDADGNLLAENTYEVVKCAFGNWSNDAIVKFVCRKKCAIPDEPRFQFTADDRKVVSSRNLVRNGQNLTVICTNNDFNSYDYYSDYDVYIPSENITCINGNLTEISLECNEVQPDECMQMENGYVNVKASGKYHVQCNDGYTLNVNTQLDCVCKEGNLSCSNQVPACLPDGCPISKGSEFRKPSVKMDGVDMTGGTTVPHDKEAVFDCKQTNEDVFEPNNRIFICKAGQWIAVDSSWDNGNNGPFPKCARLARGCTVPQWANDTNISVKNSQGKSLQTNSAIDNDDRIEISCNRMVEDDKNFTYICTDGVLKPLHNGTLQHGPGNVSICKDLARGCTIPQWANGTNIAVRNPQGKSLQTNLTIDNDDRIEINCDRMVENGKKFTYICTDGVLKLLHNGTMQHGPGDISICTVSVGSKIINYVTTKFQDIHQEITWYAEWIGQLAVGQVGTP